MTWPVGVVSDIAEVISGFAFKSEWFGVGDAKVIRIGDLKNGRVDLGGAEVFDNSAHQVRELFRIRSGDILMALSGATVGKIAVADSHAEGAYLNQRVAVIRGGCQESADYLKYVFSGGSLQKLLLNAGGAAQPNLSSKDLAGMEIPLPPLPEQKRIATILDKADAICRKRQQAIQLADDFLRAVFLDMFGDPVTNPKGWQVKPLKDLTKKIGSGSTPRGGSEAYLDQGISLIRSLNIHDDDFRIKDLAFIDDEQAERLSNVVVEKGDVLLNITGASVCRCAVVPEEILPARVNQHVCIIRPAGYIGSEYLLHLLISAPYKQKLLRMSGVGATREALTKQQVETLEIPVPPKELQLRFDGIKAKVRKATYLAINFNASPFFESVSNQAFSGQL